MMRIKIYIFLALLIIMASLYIRINLVTPVNTRVNTVYSESQSSVSQNGTPTKADNVYGGFIVTANTNSGLMRASDDMTVVATVSDEKDSTLNTVHLVTKEASISENEPSEEKVELKVVAITIPIETKTEQAPIMAPVAVSTPALIQTRVPVVIEPTDVFKLKVPYFAQQYRNSCEAASLRMALAYYGINIADDMEIVQKFGYKPRPKNVELNEWDDPREMFVGSIGVGDDFGGYGVYGAPVMKAAISYGRDASYETIITATTLAREIRAGHPIVFWGYTSMATPAYSWKVPGGGEVTAIKGEHARVLVGVAGPKDNPSGFYLNDPINGRSFEYWTTEKLMDNFYAVPGVTNQAVIVR